MRKENNKTIKCCNLMPVVRKTYNQKFYAVCSMCGKKGPDCVSPASAIVGWSMGNTKAT